MNTTTTGLVPYTHKRGTVSDNARYLTDATDKGVTWVENAGTNRPQRLCTLRNHQQSWVFTETLSFPGNSRIRAGSPRLLRAFICRNAYDEQSAIRYEVWNGNTWEIKHVLGIEGTPVEDVSYVTPLHRLDTEVFRRTADIVWDIARIHGDYA